MSERLRKACDALSENEWEDVVGAMKQRDDEFIGRNQRERDDAALARARLTELIQALREWRKSGL